MPEILNPGYEPAFGAEPSTYRAEVDRVEFEGGYSQRSRKGPNNIKREIRPEWRGLPKASADALLDFFEARGGSEAFLWAPPGDDQASLWTCAEWTESLIADGRKTVSAVFTRERDIVE